jgi:hypothetical protein
MPHDFELIIALLAPFAVITVLRINAAMAFLSLCLGYVLVELVAKDTNSLIAFLAPHTGSISQTSWRLGILFAPVVLTCIIMLFSIKGHLKNMVNALPAAATSVMAVLLAVPLFTPGLRRSIESQELWQQVNRGQALVISIGAFISLLFLWSQRRSAKKTEK